MIEYLMSLFTKPYYSITLLDSLVFLVVFILLPVFIYLVIRYEIIPFIKNIFKKDK